MKLKELFNFEEIQDVIEIGKIQNPGELVEKFVISPRLEEELLDLLNILREKKHKSVNIIGNYGTGKSHLEAFLCLVLSKPELIEYIQSDKIKQKLKDLGREFIIVKYELPATQTNSLAKIFFYRVQKQLKEEYGIELRTISTDKEDKDIKELVLEIIDKIKEKYPTKVLIVVFDEFSDFLKQKQAVDRNYDLQFYRQLGECSNSMDFMFIASMQEYIFSNPQYVDQAESIARTQQRYKDIHITNESVEKMVAKRVVTKTPNQVMEIKKLFKDIHQYFSNLAVDEDKYVELYPVHPYVIEVFSVLPFFEKRGIIQFLSKEIKRLLDNDFPEFITYDLIYDNIDRVLTIRNHPDVRPVVDAVDTLRNKIDLLDAKKRDTALKLVKALAILNLIKASNKNGASAQELANTLFIIPKTKVIQPIDDIERILEDLRRKSDGQFINKSSEGIYYLDLQKTQDYDVIIQNKVTNMNDLKYVNEKFVENFLLTELDLFYDADKLEYFDTSKKYVIEDSAYWDDRKSFRNGNLIIDIGYDVEFPEKDYTLVILGYGQKNSKVSARNLITVNLNYTDELVFAMKKLAAIEEFIRTRAYVATMFNKKRSVIDKELRPLLLTALQNSTVSYNGKNYKLSEDLGIASDVTAEVFKQIKQNLLNEEFTKEYPKYPKLKAKVSAENIISTVESILKDISQKSGIVEGLLNQSTNILLPLGLYKNNRLDVTESEYAQKILEKIEDDGKNISISDFITLFTNKPYGLHKELIYLVIACLLRNGDIILSSKRAKNYSASEFNALFVSGLKAFDDLSYIKKEEDLNVSRVQTLFETIEEDGSLLQNSRDRPEAYRKYIEKVDFIERDIKHLVEDFENIKQRTSIGMPIEDISDNIETIKNVDFSKLKIKSIVEFKKLDYSSDRLNQIRDGYKLVKQLKALFEDYFSFIHTGMSYMKTVIDKIGDNDYFKKADLEKLSGVYDDSKNILTNFKKLIKPDERKPIKGKIEEFKRKYKEVYYHTHNHLVGKDVDWDALTQVENSEELQKLIVLKTIRCINPVRLNELILKINNLKDAKCTEFSVDELDNSPVCPHCSFPMGNYDPNINNVITRLSTEITEIKNHWDLQIYKEIKNNETKVNNLDHAEKRLVQDIIAKQVLPESLDDDTVNAINSLLEDLEIKEINLKELYSMITKEADVLKVEDFKHKIEKYITEKLEAENEENVRLKVKCE